MSNNQNQRLPVNSPHLDTNRIDSKKSKRSQPRSTTPNRLRTNQETRLPNDNQQENQIIVNRRNIAVSPGQRAPFQIHQAQNQQQPQSAKNEKDVKKQLAKSTPTNKKKSSWTDRKSLKTRDQKDDLKSPVKPRSRADRPPGGSGGTGKPTLAEIIAAPPGPSGVGRGGGGGAGEEEGQEVVEEIIEGGGGGGGGGGEGLVCRFCNNRRLGPNQIVNEYWGNSNLLVCLECRINVQEMIFCRFRVIKQFQRRQVHRYLRFIDHDDESVPYLERPVYQAPEAQNMIDKEGVILNHARAQDHEEFVRLAQGNIDWNQEKGFVSRVGYVERLPKKFQSFKSESDSANNCLICSFDESRVEICVECFETFEHNIWSQKTGGYLFCEQLFDNTGKCLALPAIDGGRQIVPNYFICTDFDQPFHQMKVEHWKTCRACRLNRIFELEAVLPNVRFPIFNVP